MKEKRRMVRNPFINNQYQYPYQGNQQPFFGNYYHPYPIQNNQPYHYSFIFGQSPMTGPGFTPFQMPYPNQGPRPVHAPKGGFQSILNQFKTKDGNYDLNKMMSTAGQMMNTMNQLNGMVKQVGSFFKLKA
jgi:hypothetical protein